MSSPGSGEANPGTNAMACILWTRIDHPAPAALTRVLEQRHLSIVTVHHRFGAIAELCLAHGKLSAENSLDRPQAVRGPILVLVEPEQLDGADDVASLMGMYAPKGLCWRYSTASTPKLGMYVRPADAPRPRPPQPEIVITPHAMPSGIIAFSALEQRELPIKQRPDAVAAPRLRLTETEDDLADNKAVNKAQASFQAASVAPEPIRPAERRDFSRIITEDELSMLLNDRAKDRA